jgi:hypothetical protein
MSTLDQPQLIANSNYHVGHQVAIFVAKEQGFFKEEGLKEYDYDARGLIPGPMERDGLAMAITNHGVDIATAVDVEAAITSARSAPASISPAAGATRRFSGGTARSDDLRAAASPCAPGCCDNQRPDRRPTPPVWSPL